MDNKVEENQFTPVVSEYVFAFFFLCTSELESEANQLLCVLAVTGYATRLICNVLFTLFPQHFISIII